ncbi:membrane hypothetical protein [Vibrio coralliirubri]|uniref:Uncharacterized protein n=1 Tax=Vibrio coralliirubri TaxID=1516159 RepID=A0AA87C405_9VIBR|nr:hypothetical protein [Vibrio coralliirubri]CDU10779.1 membrane hypothetical protein [Vibrio coralliirubri]
MLKNVIKVLTSKMIASGMYFATNLMVINSISVEDYANFSLVIVMLPLIAFLCNAGTNKSGLLLTKRDELEVDAFVTLKVVYISIVTIVALIIGSYFSLGLFIVVSGISLATVELGLTALQIQERFRNYSILNGFRNIIWGGITVFMFYFSDISIDKALNALVFSSLLSAVLSFFFIFKKIRLSYIFEKKPEFTSFLRTTNVFFATELSLQVMMRMEAWILAIFIKYRIVESTELAIFNAAFMFAFVLPMITNSVYSVIMPSLLNKESNKADEIYEKISNNKFLIFSFVGTAAIIGALAINVLLPADYKSSTIPFVLICVAISVSFITNVIQISIIKSGNETFVKSITVWQMMISVPISFLCIYFGGAIGGAFSILITRILGFVRTNIVVKSLYAK